MHFPYSFEAALASDDDMLLDLSYPQSQDDFFAYLEAHTEEIERLVSHHLGLSLSTQGCTVSSRSEWMGGYFNICIPIRTDRGPQSPSDKVLLRVALPFKLGEANMPGNVEEKLRCEAATYIWIHQNCPSVPIPRLWGCGFPSGSRLSRSSVAHKQDSGTISNAYSWHPYPDNTLRIGYLIVDYIKPSQGQLLSTMWTQSASEAHRRDNFFADLSHVVLALAQFPFDRIGSLTIDDDATPVLQNRPLTCRLSQLENRGVLTGIPRNTTYSRSDLYFTDMLVYHANRIRYQRNPLRDYHDGETQLGVQASVRDMLPSFSSSASAKGPYILTLTDIHPNNVFVDENWHIVSLFDLEWTCVRPLEFVLAPVWLTGRKVDQLPRGSEHLGSYLSVLNEFLDTFKRTEMSHAEVHGRRHLLSEAMRASFTSGSFWFFQALENPKVLCTLFHQHLLPVLAQGKANKSSTDVSKRATDWGPDAYEIIEAKLEDRQRYENQLRMLYENNMTRHSSS